MKLSRIDYIGLNGGDGEHYAEMTDTVERLRKKLGEDETKYEFFLNEISYEIESLRKQVNELEYQSDLRAKVAQSWADKVGGLYQELAALKAGEKK